MRDLINASEAARRLGVSRAWINKLCNEGRIPGAKKVGRVWAIPVGAKIKDPPPKVPVARPRRVTRIPGKK